MKIFLLKRKNVRMKSKAGPAFSEKCYRILSQVPKGKVTTYAQIARALGTRAFRAVGQAMRRNPHAPKVPCHRVVRSDGDLGGYSGGLAKKKLLLRSEGIQIKGNKVVNLSACLKRLSI